MKTPPLVHPHDKFFKNTFSRTDVVKSFISEYLPSEYKEVINIDTLEAIKDSHVNPELYEFFSDAVYAAKLYQIARKERW
jgi:hypothetical protein